MPNPLAVVWSLLRSQESAYAVKEVRLLFERLGLCLELLAELVFIHLFETLKPPQSKDM